jgi:hypothetical protein
LLCYGAGRIQQTKPEQTRLDSYVWNSDSIRKYRRLCTSTSRQDTTVRFSWAGHSVSQCLPEKNGGTENFCGFYLTSARWFIPVLYKHI